MERLPTRTKHAMVPQTTAIVLAVERLFLHALDSITAWGMRASCIEEDAPISHGGLVIVLFIVKMVNIFLFSQFSPLLLSSSYAFMFDVRAFERLSHIC